MNNLVFKINPNGSVKENAIIFDDTKVKMRNCKRPGGFLWGSTGASCTC